MFLWIATWLCLFFGLSELKPVQHRLKLFLGQKKMILDLRLAIRELRLLQEMLESGVVPAPEQWAKIELFPAPWGLSLSQSLKELRNQGAPVLPSLARMQHTLEEQTELIQEARVKSSQAFGQAVLGMLLVPVFSLVLYFLLPGIEESKKAFFLLVLFSLLLSSIAFIWMMAMVDQARFGNIRSENRKWLVTVHSTVERILALLSSGLPPDLAWRQSIEELAAHDPKLAHAWKPQVWDSDFSTRSGANECEQLILNVGVEIRKSIQTSLIEGQGCLDRIESIHRAFLLDLKMRIGRELSVLPNRCLKPLFIFVLPSIMLLMFGSFAISLCGFLNS